MTSEEYNVVLPRFITEARKRNGDRYAAKTLWQLMVNIRSFVRMKDRAVSCIKDNLYKSVADALDVAMKQSSYIGETPTHQADTISSDIETRMWLEGALVLNHSSSSIYILMFCLGYLFVLRASDHKHLVYNENIKEFLIFF